MDTDTKQGNFSIAFINDKSPILDKISTDLSSAGFKILLQAKGVENVLSQLERHKGLPDVCIIDLDFYDKNVLKQLQKLRNIYPTIRLIAHSDIDDEKIGKYLSEIGFLGFLPIGRDTDNFKKAIDKAVNG